MRHDLTRKSPRLSYFDYSTPGAYFFTINARNKANLFGQVTKSGIQHNELGKMIHDHWFRLQDHYTLIELDEFTVMPNHIHGIILIKWQSCLDKVGAASGSRTDTSVSDTVSTPTLAVIINGFKSGVTREFRKLNPQWQGSVWHRSFYDHIIRNEDDLYECRKYIRDNPLRWFLS